MVDWKGAQTIAGMVYSGGGNWGTEVACAGSSAFEFESESLNIDSQFVPNTGITGNVAQIAGSKGNELHSGDIVIPMDYNIVQRFIAQVMGTAVAPDAAGTGWNHVLNIKDDLEGIHGTLVLGMPSLFARVYPTVKFTGFTLDCAAGEQAKLTMNTVPGKILVDDSGTNNLASLSSITRPTDIEPIEFNHLEVWLNTQVGGALTVSFAKYLSAISLTVTNNMRDDSVTTRDAPYTDEPKRNGWLDVTGTLTFAELNANTHITDHLDKQVQKMRIIFTGAAWAVQAPRCAFYMPGVQFESTDYNIAGPELAPNTVGFRCSRALSLPTGENSTDILQVQVKNLQNSNALSGI